MSVSIFHFFNDPINFARYSVISYIVCEGKERKKLTSYRDFNCNFCRSFNCFKDILTTSEGEIRRAKSICSSAKWSGLKISVLMFRWFVKKRILWMLPFPSLVPQSRNISAPLILKVGSPEIKESRTYKMGFKSSLSLIILSSIL